MENEYTACNQCEYSAQTMYCIAISNLYSNTYCLVQLNFLCHIPALENTSIPKFRSALNLETTKNQQALKAW